MSWWTHIRGSIQVSVPGRTQAECRYILDTVLEHLPLVTGSEGDMKVHVVQRHGYNCSSSCDEFGMRTNNLKDDYGDHTRRMGWLHKQDQYILTIEADLRDRMFLETKKEFMKWICRLAKRVYVEDVLVRVWGDGYKQFVLNDRRKFYKMNEPPSWSSGKDATGEPCWWEYLFWERYPSSDLPLMHVRKYYIDEKVDQEIERRKKWEEEMEDADG